MALPGSQRCVLHIPFPEDAESDEYQQLKKLKEGKVQEKIDAEDYNFEGAKIFVLDLSGRTISRDLKFEDAEIYGPISFQDTEISGNASFEKATIYKIPIFKEAKIRGVTIFTQAKFLEKRKKEYDSSQVWVDWFLNSEFHHGLYFTDAKIEDPRFQSQACRRAKVSLNNIGDRYSEDIHHRQEMEALWQINWEQLEEDRNSPNIMKNTKALPYVFEFVIARVILRYGTSANRLLKSWGFVIFLFAVIYYFFQVPTSYQNWYDFFNSIRFSALIGTTIGLGTASSPDFDFLTQLLIGIEALIGAFAWAALILVVGRKYMR